MPSNPPRPAFAAFLLALAFILAVPLSRAIAAPEAAAASPSHPIVEAALRHVGEWQGECFTFAQRMVQEGTGQKMGYDYHQGYLDGGAVEIGPEQAGPGDIIQLADRRDTSPSADYPGLHTAIVIESLGGGNFKVIDSNSQWDGVVRVREYNPSASAARYTNISVRFYRFTPAPGFKPSVPAAGAQPVPEGEKAVVKAGGDCLNLRDGIGTDKRVIGCIPDGAEVTIIDGSGVSSGGRVWIKVATRQGTGWVAAEFIQRRQSAASGNSPVKPLTGYRLYVGTLAADSASGN